jgi:hypothetical protein
MKVSSKVLIAAVVCCVLCVLLSIAAVSLDQYACSRIDPSNRLALCLDNCYNLSHWAYLLYDLFHLFVIAVFALFLAESLSWEAWMGGSASIVSTLADMGSLCVKMFIVTAGLRALALGNPSGLVTPEAGYEFIGSTLDFANASFGIVGTLFLGTAAIKATGVSKIVGWFLLAGLPLGILQFAEVGLSMPWTYFVDIWITPLDEVVQQILIGIAFWTILRQRHEQNRSLQAAEPASLIRRGG